ncbi:MAG: glycine--tRNA ligase [Candidatus Harrisonbacteria bacterium CG10_big_fil_rev_8_21_14_0_10_44_23]|uniref:Glycine--tRNA ligase n=1 Tax=Candidatus Harrisonbacteria bacterium CG10_big_fil_rev_8_21_14_0_10_44_23 TaxID=1974585 RepID=A0A2H0UQT8_9BACT|nr:MAG: glycine--tRNA ligase [Candidatus Harrisonbacteria bacterium CG10_big_fil_rev_8_21_14_0_10_44_23]
MNKPKEKFSEDKMKKIISLAKRRGFIFPGSEIYGGLQNSWDYGPLGVELKNNIKQEWWRRFVHARADMVGLDAALIMNPQVWEASGHIKNFTDPLVECKQCHGRFRSDTLDDPNKCPKCGTKGSFTESQEFNMMLETYIGPAREKANIAYFRPETAQAIFVDFKQILDTSRKRIPFGVAQIGKAFRNEITPGNYIFRTREFEQMEIEFFIKETEWEKWFEHWLGEMKTWIKDLGIDEKNVEYIEIPDGERAHYSKRTVDIEYKFPFGQKELYGLAYRGDYDLTSHMKESGKDLSYTNPEDPSDKFVPHVIEPSLGVDRTLLAVMLDAYTEEKAGDEERVVMKFEKWLAPKKVAVLPLMRKEELVGPVKEIFITLSKQFVCDYDETGSIGKRYRRQDEIGTPYCVTFDYDSLEDKAVTVRDRDTMAQERIKIEDLGEYLKKGLKG